MPIDCDPNDYVSYSTLVPAATDEVPPYEVAALVPEAAYKAFWPRPLERAEAILAERVRPMVSLVRMDHALAPIIGSGLSVCDVEAASTLAATFPIDAVLAASLNALRPLFVWSASTFSLIGLATGPAGKRTTTVNPKNGLRLGLHFDSWDMMPLHERGASRYRISVNVGSEDRAFLFVAVSGVEVIDAVNVAEVNSMNATTLFRRFAAGLPMMQVIRLRVPPGWAYVAPTDNLPHDGSTIGASRVDFSLHALADFRPIKRFFGTSTFFDLRHQDAPGLQ